MIILGEADAAANAFVGGIATKKILVKAVAKARKRGDGSGGSGIKINRLRIPAWKVTNFNLAESLCEGSKNKTNFLHKLSRRNFDD